MAAIRVLVPLAPGFEELELVAPVDLLRRAGAEVTVASVDGASLVVGRAGMVLRAERTFDEALAEPEVYDLVLLPGGPAVAALRADARVLGIVRSAAARGAWLAAICAAPLVLKDAGVLPAEHTAHDSCLGELPAARLDQRVVVSGRTITSRGAGTAIDFGLALVAALFGSAKADEVRKAILA